MKYYVYIHVIYLHQFSIVALESHRYSAGDTIRMRLMKRAKV